MPLSCEIPYRADSTVYLETLSDLPWAVYLDSARTRSGSPPGSKEASDRYDIIAAAPAVTLTTRGEVTEIRSRTRVRLSPQDPFSLLREQLRNPYGSTAKELPIEPVDRETISEPDLPFRGGAIGWFGYDLGRRIEQLPVRARDCERIPDMAVGIYDWALIVDHARERAWLVGHGRDPLTHGRWDALVSRLRDPSPPVAHGATKGPFRVLDAPRSNMSRAEYGQAFARVKSYIREGDCYQVNLAQRFSVPVTGDPFDLYRRLRRLNPAPFCAFLRTPDASILSSSPERFLAVRHGRVETRPIKGTRPRGRTPREDTALQRELANSAKDRAENLMIVDLLRNDLGRVCRPGSIQVPQLFSLESFASVHHLVSTVTGRLASGQDTVSLLRACFPGGSITGAPKIRAMEIIEELEPHRRGVYSGAIGYLGFDGSMDTNIAIRTLVQAGGTIRFWAGGGIVHDSQEEAEYQETLDKAAVLMQLLDSDYRFEPCPV